SSRQPLGYAIVGGIAVATVLTLFLVPVVYVIVDGLLARTRRRAPSLTPASAPRTPEAQ
ncbi:MAG: efflux RND transporter permease subunit, partial [Gemmatimonadales bacterium]